MFGINQRKLRLCLVQWQLADFTVYTVILKFKCFQWLIDLNLGMWSVITSVFLVIIEVNLINICYLSGKIRLAVTDTEIWKLPHQLKDQDQHLYIINRLFLNLSQILGMFILMSTAQTECLYPLYIWCEELLDLNKHFFLINTGQIQRCLRIATATLSLGPTVIFLRSVGLINGV